MDLQFGPVSFVYVQQLGISSTPQCLQDLLTPREVVDDPHTARCRLFELLLLDFIAAEVGRGEGKLDKQDETKRKAELLMFVVYKAGKVFLQENTFMHWCITPF